MNLFSSPSEGTRRRPRALKSVETRRPSPAAALLSSVLPELERAAAQVAVAGSMANAMVRNDDRSGRPTLEDLAAQLPADLNNAMVVAVDLLGFEIGADVLVRIQVFNARLNFAKRLTSQGCGERTVPGQQPRITESKICLAWQTVAEALLAALDSAQGGLVKLGGTLSPISYRLNKLLSDVRDGRAPCLDQHGKPDTEAMCAPRESSRRSVEKTCYARFSETTSNVVLCDLSRSGAGFIGRIQSPRGAAVTILLHGDREITGQVAWVAGNRWGMCFNSNLLPDDPLFTGDRG